MVVATVLLPPEKFSNMSKSENIPTEKKKILLTSKDQLYSGIRDCNFNAVGFQLKNKAEELTDKFEVANVTSLLYLQLNNSFLGTTSYLVEFRWS